MRLAALLPMLCLLPELAAAQTPECRTIPKATDRLACYDKATPQAAQASRPAAPKPASAEQLAPLGDMLAAENSKLDAKIKGICRGC